MSDMVIRGCSTDYRLLVLEGKLRRAQVRDLKICGGEIYFLLDGKPWMAALPMSGQRNYVYAPEGYRLNADVEDVLLGRGYGPPPKVFDLFAFRMAIVFNPDWYEALPLGGLYGEQSAITQLIENEGCSCDAGSADARYHRCLAGRAEVEWRILQRPVREGE